MKIENMWLLELSESFMKACFNEGKRIGIMEDGHYDVKVDVDFLFAFSNK